MATKRTRRTRRGRLVITEAMVEAYNADDILVLHNLLRLTPWNWSPLEAADPSPPSWERADRRADYLAAHELRCSIIQAGGNADVVHDHEAWMARRDIAEAAQAGGGANG